jgi:hypothetical protein
MIGLHFIDSANESTAVANKQRKMQQKEINPRSTRRSAITYTR